MSKALLLDLSLRCTGYAVIPWPPTFDTAGFYQDSLIAKGEFPLERADLSIQERVGTLKLLLGGLIDQYEPLFVAAEMPTNMFQARPGGKSVSSSSSVLMQQRAFGAAMAEFWSRGVPFIEVDPTQSKTALTGNRTASKDLVKEYLALRFGMKKEGVITVRWPKGWTEAVRDALAVLFFLDYRYRLFPQGDWLDRLLIEQHKPVAGEHLDRRLLCLDALWSEAFTRNKQPVQTRSTTKRRKRTAIP